MQSALILRSERRARLEGWQQARPAFPPFETAAARPPQREAMHDLRRHQARRRDQDLRRQGGCRRRGHARHRGRRVLLAAGSVGLRQDHVLAHDRGLRDARLRAASMSAARTSPTCRCIGATWAWCSSPMRCFPHRTVAENVAFGLRMRDVAKPEIARRVAAALAQVALTGLEDRQPGQLSGGQQQRVALARALVVEPRVLLCDEPLGALDRKLRQQMQFELKELQRRLGVTLVFVTHDQEEALAMSDRIAVMNAGRVEQVGAPTEIYERPRTRFVADFIGEINLLEEGGPAARAAAGEDPPWSAGGRGASRRRGRDRQLPGRRHALPRARRRPHLPGPRGACRRAQPARAGRPGRPCLERFGHRNVGGVMPRTLGIITIGQAPRDDIAGLFAAHAPAGTKVVLRGALDGLSDAEVDKLRPESGADTLYTRSARRQSRREDLQEGRDRPLARDDRQAARRRLRRHRLCLHRRLPADGGRRGRALSLARAEWAGDRPAAARPARAS